MEEKIFGRKSLGELICTNDKNYLTMMQIFSLFLNNFEKEPKSFISQLKKLDPDVFPFLKKNCGVDKKSITIMTSHLSKGLEFDTIFALSLYSRIKTLPKNLQEAISLDKEKMRLLYVTLTRAKSNLFIYGTLIGSLFPLNKGCGSPLELFLARVNKDFLSYDQLYKNIPTLCAKEICHIFPIPTSIIEPQDANCWDIDDDHTTIFAPDELRIYKKMPKSLSFSSLPFKKNEFSPVDIEPEFPCGAKAGHQIHLIIEKILEEGLYYPFKKEMVFPVIEKSVAHSQLASYEQIIYKKLEVIFQTPLKSHYDTFSLASIPPHHMWGEVLFRYKLANSSVEMNGFADLIMQYNDRFYIVDWKCNHLEGYTPQTINDALEHHHYKKQAAIYTKALKLFLQSKSLCCQKHMGGTFYVFIRGEEDGIHYFSPKAMEDEEILCMK